MAIVGDLGRYERFIEGWEFRVYAGVQAILWLVTGVVFSNWARRYYRYTLAIHEACVVDTDKLRASVQANSQELVNHV